MARIISALMLTLYFSALPCVAMADDDDLDDTFGDGKGWVTYSSPGAIRNFDDIATAMLRQSDGKTVLIGQGLDNKIQLARYLTNGALDEGFGTNGLLLSTQIIFTAYGNALAQQSDGKLLIPGWTPDAIGHLMPSLLRLNNNGTPDASFGVKGVSQLKAPNFNSMGVFKSVIQQADGKLVAVGFQDPLNNGENISVILARFNLDGSLDTSFGSNGIFVTPMKSTDASVIQQTDGQLVVAGAHAENPSQPVMSALRVTSAGLLDTTFSGTGFFVSDVVAGLSQAVVQQTDGRLVIAGGPQGVDFALIRLNINGSLDTSFDADGKVLLEFGGNSDANLVAIQQDQNNKLIVAGWVNLNPGYVPTEAALVRFNTDGSLDNGFGNAGVVITDTGSEVSGYALAKQPDGKLLVGGSGYYDEIRGSDFYLSRYNADGSIDSSFGDAGVVRTNFRGPDDTAAAEALLQQSNGKLVAAGKLFDANNLPHFGLVRYSKNGTLDTNFNGAGDVVTPIGIESYLTDLIQQSDGKLVAAGDTIVDHLEYHRHMALARYNLDGSLDSSFGGTGIVTAVLGDDAPNDNHLVESVIQQVDGKLVAAGNAHYFDDAAASVHSYDFALARFNSDGSPDAGFGGTGIVITDLGADYEGAYQVTQQSDRKLVAAGYASNGANSDFAIVRYNSDGSLDAGFGDAGIVITDFSPEPFAEDVAQAVLQQPDGKLVVAGGYDRFKLARYNIDGSLDATFGVGGKVIGAYAPLNALDIKKAILRSDGAITVIATDYDFFGRNFIVVTRYMASGEQDFSLTDTAGVSAPASRMAFSMAGAASNVVSNSMVAGDGALKLNLESGFSEADIRAASLQANGDLIAAGKCRIAGGSAFQSIFVARFNLSSISKKDRDGDGIRNHWDIYPDDPTRAGDRDEDGIDRLVDNCRHKMNADQADLDGDGIGNVCDRDRDGDAFNNGKDRFPDDALQH